MNLSRDDSCALNIWQRLHFDTDSLKNPSTRADAWRRLLLQLRISRNSNRISSQLYTRLLRVLATNYCQITDNQDPSQGLNNFAEAVLTLASGCQNESQNWCSGLSLSNVQNLPIYKSLVAKDPLGDQKTRKPLQSNFDGSQSTVSALSSSENRLYDQTAVIREGNAVNDKMSVTEPNFTAHFSAKFEKSDTNSFEKHSQTFSSAGVLLNTVYQHQRELSIDSIPQNTENFRSIVLGSESDRGIKQQKTDAFSNCSNSRFKSSAGIKRKAENPFSDGSGVNGVSSHLNAEQKSYGPGTFSNTGSTFAALDNNKNSPPVHDPTHQLNANQLTTRPIYLEKCGDKRFSRKAPDMQSCSDDDHNSNAVPNFITARQQLMINSKKKNHHHEGAINSANYGSTRKTLGTRRGPSRQFVPPVINHSQNNDVMERELKNDVRTNGEPEMDERLKNIDPKMIELIRNEIMDHGPPLSWDDIAGLEFAKSVIKEIVVWPMLRPDIFKGLRGPPKGVLLFGPPGTGKTLIGKCIASQSKATFFSISASSLTSKWVGEGEKMVRALFAVARCHLPAVIFIDEIDSLLSQRTDGEHDASRRIKTEFLVQLDGATTNSDDRLLVVGATNRPQEIDEAARRRLVKRLYIPLPDAGAREQIISSLLSQQKCSLSGQEIKHIVERTQGYSGSDMANLCREAALGPIRSISDIQCIDADQVPPIVFKDFDAALHQVRASVSEKDLNLYTQWNKLYGSGSK